MKDKMFYVIVCVALLVIALGISIVLHAALNEGYAEAATQSHQQLSRSEQVRIMQECYEDAGKIHRYVSYRTEYKVSIANLFFIYRTGMAINNNLVQPELSQWNDE